jgi:hypothetical protein
MCRSNQTFFITSWDLRLLWSVSSIILRAYLVVFLVSAAFIAASASRTLVRLARRPGDSQSQETLPPIHVLKGRIHARFRLLSFLLLGFGVAISREVLGSIQAVRMSFLSLSKYQLEDALEAPVAFCFVSMLIFFATFSLLWLTETRLNKSRPPSSA